MKRPVNRKSLAFVGALLASSASLALLAESSGIPKISSFAPAADLIAQVDYYVGRVEQSLANPADFDPAKQSRTLKDAHTIAVLALMLAFHDEQSALSAPAEQIISASKRLGVAGENYDAAKQALADIKAARAQPPVQTTRANWEKVAALAPLMKQVPIIHIALKRGVEPGRLARQAATSAGQAAALAAIAEVSTLDGEYVRDPSEIGAWRACCVEMRDAAGEVNSAVHANDEARVSGGMKRLAQSCETCHEKFRRP